MSPRPPKGFILPLALVFLGILLLLLLNLTALGRTGDQIFLKEELQFQKSLLAFQTQNSLGVQLVDPNRNPPGPASLERDFKVTYEEAKLAVKWGKDESVNRPVERGWANYTQLFKQLEDIPLASYEDADLAFEGQEVAADHTLVQMKSSDKSNLTVYYSAGFPFGAYAPYGEVHLEKALSWSNPSLEASTKSKEHLTGLPVNIVAQGELEIEKDYPLGEAHSETGPISLPPHSGGIGYTRTGPGENYTNELRSEIERAFRGISKDQIDKTHLFDDAVLNVGTLVKIFAGTADLRSIIGIGQAHKVPFFPIPSLQDDLLVFVFALHHPWPMDFGGQEHKKKITEELVKLNKAVKDKEEEIGKLELEISGLDPDKDQDKIDALEEKLTNLEEELVDLKEERDKAQDEIKKSEEDIADNIALTEVPTNSQEERKTKTEGWAYVQILGRLAQLLEALFHPNSEGKNQNPNSGVLSALFVETRVVNLGNQDPDWEWESDSITMTGTLTVPRGRTLRLHKNLRIQGDLWLQRGSTFHLKGSDLTLHSPGSWKDFQGEETTTTGTASWPKGRLLMEPGSTLLVEGDLRVKGGNHKLGSVVLISHIGPTRAIDQAIVAQGNVDISHGIYPGMGVDDLVRALAPKDKNLQGFVDDFYNPLMVEAFPFIAKFPYVGPWQWRKCWFADYATTFEFIPEVVVYPGPYPIPLPFPNCLKKVFKYVSIAYSTELNFATGENLYTQSPFWPFGRGVTPILTKTDPELVAEAFEGLKWDKIVLDALLEEGQEFLADVLPELVKEIITTAIRDVLLGLLEELVPFDPPSCGGSSGGGTNGEDEGIAGKIKEKMEEFIKDFLKDEAKALLQSLKTATEKIRHEILEHIDEELPEKTILRELPGVLVYSGGDMTIGNPSSLCASGMFFAEGDLDIKAKYAVGCMLSGQGDIRAETLYHYPYYSRVSLYNPLKPNEYPFNVVDDFFRSAFQVEIPNPKKDTALDVGRPTYHITAKGWNR